MYDILIAPSPMEIYPPSALYFIGMKLSDPFTIFPQYDMIESLF